MLTFVVMPCLNEAELIGQTVRSLGFDGETSPDSTLICVDNGSIDNTVALLDELQVRNPDRLRIVHEPERGFVPPRRRGVVEATRIADGMRMHHGQVLVLQADADTVYKPGYIAAMQRAAVGAQGAILEGATRRPPGFEREHPEYVAAERMVDAATEPMDAADEEEVVVDDKACGYLLADYIRWGGLREELDEAGEVIHAETTRMFIHARLSAGARKVRVNPAGAASSRRRIEENPRLQFATSGFPRERSWIEALAARGLPPLGIDEFARKVLQGGEQETVHLRRAHQIALFRFLPALISRATHDTAEPQPRDVEEALGRLPARSAEELAARPGAAIMDVLRLIETEPWLFQSGST